MAGGAALSKKFVETRLSPVCKGGAHYAKDAMSGLAIALVKHIRRREFRAKRLAALMRRIHRKDMEVWSREESIFMAEKERVERKEKIIQERKL